MQRSTSRDLVAGRPARIIALIQWTNRGLAGLYALIVCPCSSVINVRLLRRICPLNNTIESSRSGDFRVDEGVDAATLNWTRDRFPLGVR